eukprot:7016812-Pyramimonas_sp.AAC.1
MSTVAGAAGPTCAAGDFRAVRKLGSRCEGPPPTESTRRNRLDAIRRVEKGLSPRVRRSPAAQLPQ